MYPSILLNRSQHLCGNTKTSKSALQTVPKRGKHTLIPSTKCMSQAWIYRLSTTRNQPFRI